MTQPPLDDPMWPEFKPLWCELQKAGRSLLVAGGYGLFLKQHWLLAQRDLPTIVPLRQWVDAAPRVTKDVDIIVSLDLIASREAQAHMAQALRDHEFIELDPRWQFRKHLSADRHITIEFHSRLAAAGDEHVDMDRVRVKHKPSLGRFGIHGRQNPEAHGDDHHPFEFEIDDVGIAVPNPITWCVMKLTAMHDRRLRADDGTQDEQHRTFNRAQAIKHARDVCRTVALTTAQERDRASGVIKTIHQTTEYQKAIQVCADYFSPAGWATQVTQPLWTEADLILLRQTLSGWFSDHQGR